MPEDNVTVITNPSQLAPPPPARRVKVDVPELRAVDGSPARLFAQALTAYEFGEYEASLRDDDGYQTNKTNSHHQMKFLAWTIRDTAGNRLWQTEKAAIDQLGAYGNAVVSKLFVKAVEVNAAASEGATDRAEGNSDATPNGSTSGT